MLKTVKGIYRDGKVELLEVPSDITEGEVLVTFVKVSVGEVTQFPEKASRSPLANAGAERADHSSERIYRKNGILVAETGRLDELDTDAFIESLREERIQGQIDQLNL